MHHLSFFAGAVLYILYFVGEKRSVRFFSRLFILAGFFLLTAVLFGRSLIAGGFSVLGLHESLLFFAWLIVAILLISEFKSGNSANGIIALPVVVALLGVARFIDSAIKPIPPALQSGWLGIHVTSCFLGYACFVLGFCFALLYLWQEAEIRSHKVDRNFFRLPSLEMLDSMEYRAVALGFVFLSIGIISGSMWAQRAWGAFWNWDPKETFSLALWFVYLVYLHGRIARGWQGRRSAYCAIAGFILMIFTYIGASFMFSGLHSYL